MNGARRSPWRRSQPGSRRGSSLAAVTLVATLGAVAVVAGREARAAESIADSLGVRAAALVCAGDLPAALAIARDVERRLAADPAVRPWRRSDARRLVRRLEAVLALSRDAQRAFAAATCLEDTIRALWRQGDFTGAAACSQRQLDARRRCLEPSDPDLARSLGNLAYSLRGHDGLAGAAQAFRAALACYDAAGERCHPLVAYCAEQLARLELAGARYGAADSAGCRWLAAVTCLQGPADLAVAGCQDLLAQIADAAENRDLAIRHWSAALAIRRRILGDQDLATLDTVYEIARMHYALGHFGLARSLHAQVLAGRRAQLPADDPRLAASLDALAAALAELGLHTDADSLLCEALAIRRRILGDQDLAIAESLNNIATSLDRQGQDAAAEELFRQALAIKLDRLTSDHPDLALAWHNIAVSVLRQGRADEAEAILRRELAILTGAAGEHARDLAECRHDLARSLRAQGRWAAADSLFRACIAGYRQAIGEPHHLVAMALEDLAISQLQQHRDAAAESLLAVASEVYEAVRPHVDPGFERATFQESPYRALAVSRLRLGDVAGAWDALERALGRSLGELLQAHVTPDVPSGRRTCEPVFTPLPLETAAATLAPGAALVGWLALELDPGETTAWGFVVRDRGPVHWTCLDADPRSAAAPADAMIAPLRRRLVAAASWPFQVPREQALLGAARRAYETWWRPLLPWLDGVKHLVVVSPGPWLGVPIESFLDSEGRYLLDRYTVTYTHSASVHAQLRRRPAVTESRPLARALLIGDPEFAGAQRRVRWTADEVRAVAACFPQPVVRLGREASETALDDLDRTGALASFDVIHVATHAEIDPGRPLESALLLAVTNLADPLAAAGPRAWSLDGRLTAREVLGEWDLAAELVTLSCCSTALGRRVVSEGYIGLPQAFLLVGARAVLCSLWPVPEEATALLMGRFYELLTGRQPGAAGAPGPLPAAEALRRAKQWLRTLRNADGTQLYAHPAYWSAFVIFGDPDPETTLPAHADSDPNERGRGD